MTAQIQGDLFAARVAPDHHEEERAVFSPHRLPGMDAYLTGVLVQEGEYEYRVPAASMGGKEAGAMK